MKLNLLPTRIKKESSGNWAWIPAILLAAAGWAWAIYIGRWADGEIDKQKQRIEAARPDAEEAVRVVAQSDQIIQQSRGLILNSNLAASMLKHNTAYTETYDEAMKYIPSFFRPYNMQLVPNGSTSATLSMTGAIGSFQQYADLMAALYRIPGATAVTRSGFSDDFATVPNLIETDQTGRKFKPSESRLPDDPMDRMNTQIANSGTPDFNGTGGFGGFGDADSLRQAMEGNSDITVTVTLARDVTTPDPRGTLAQAAALWPAAGAAAPVPGATAPAGTPPSARPTGTQNPGSPPPGNPGRSREGDDD
jgi:hypothetical protein